MVSESKVSQDLGTMAASGATKPIIVHQIRRRRSDLLGQISDHCAQKLA